MQTLGNSNDITVKRLYLKNTLLLLTSFFLITFGQPAELPMFGLLGAFFGYSLFFLIIIDCSAWNRFLITTLFFTASQAVQLRWFLAHPYWYLYPVWLLIALVIGVQFGIFSLTVTRDKLRSLSSIFFLPALWVLLEWSRLFIFSGFSFCPIGFALTCNSSTLQAASLFGVYGLSFWVMFTNCATARGIILFQEKKRFIPILTSAFIFSLPILYGFGALSYHIPRKALHDRENQPFKTLIVQSAIRPDEVAVNLDVTDTVAKPFHQAHANWKLITENLKPYQGKNYDLILLPEIVVPYPAEAQIFRLKTIREIFVKAGLLQEQEETPTDASLFSEISLSSLHISRTIAHLFSSPVLIGLEGTDYIVDEDKEAHYNSAFFVDPTIDFSLRYDKQILVPMGEYIPVDWARHLTANYGLFESFRNGETTKIFNSKHHKLGVSICYEETFGHFMKKNKNAGATVLVNLTNDGWYPNSSLGWQHFAHACPRTVENGLPLVRASNWGVSGAIDSLGSPVVLSALDGGNNEKLDAFVAKVSTYTYPTLYSKLGDTPVILLSFLFAGFWAKTAFVWPNRKTK